MPPVLHPFSVLPVLLTAVLLLGACSSEEEPPSSGPASATGTPEPEPVAFGFGGAEPGRDGTDGTSSIRLSCTPYREYLLYEQVTVDTPVVLRAIRSDGLEVGRSWVTGNRRQRMSSGMIAVGAPGGQITDQPGWRERTPLAGTGLSPGTTYTFFVELSLPLGASQDELSFDYVVGDRSETVSWPYTMDRVRRCR
ncbi:MAG: hypothetical protein JWN84_3075 [Nocardioides sp.]|nr:hypothetical protein [Nocardioides sp.]